MFVGELGEPLHQQFFDSTGPLFLYGASDFHDSTCYQVGVRSALINETALSAGTTLITTW